MKGFFKTSSSKAPFPTIPRCGSCGLRRKCKTPKMTVVGRGRKSILVVGTHPTKEADSRGGPFTGSHGERVRDDFKAAGLDLEKDCWKTYAVNCCVRSGEIPKQSVASCRPLLLKAIAEYKPKVIVLMGSEAIESVFGYIRSEEKSIQKWAGWTIPYHDWNAWICPIKDVAHVEEEDSKAIDLEWGRHIRAIAGKVGEALPPIPKANIEIEFNNDRAVGILTEFYENPAPIAFDYETNMLKPDSPEAAIVTCSVCWAGRRTIAFNWTEETKWAMWKLLLSHDHPKIASNMKFEERWTRAIMDISVQEWQWDTMLAAHVLDNRSGITSVKFQAFVLLGQESYDDEISSYLKSDNSNTPNRIYECDREKLLEYNGLDSFLEYRVSQIQMKAFGYPFVGGK